MTEAELKRGLEVGNEVVIYERGKKVKGEIVQMEVKESNGHKILNVWVRDESKNAATEDCVVHGYRTESEDDDVIYSKEEWEASGEKW